MTATANTPAALALAFLLLALISLREVLRAAVWPRWRWLILALGLLIIPVLGTFLGYVAGKVLAAVQ